jgi:hypothetical protein
MAAWPVNSKVAIQQQPLETSKMMKDSISLNGDETSGNKFRIK